MEEIVQYLRQRLAGLHKKAIQLNFDLEAREITQTQFDYRKNDLEIRVNELEKLMDNLNFITNG